MPLFPQHNATHAKRTLIKSESIIPYRTECRCAKVAVMTKLAIVHRACSQTQQQQCSPCRLGEQSAVVKLQPPVPPAPLPQMPPPSDTQQTQLPRSSMAMSQPPPGAPPPGAPPPRFPGPPVPPSAVSSGVYQQEDKPAIACLLACLLPNVLHVMRCSLQSGVISQAAVCINAIICSSLLHVVSEELPH